jgi:hypothetical protein
LRIAMKPAAIKKEIATQKQMAATAVNAAWRMANPVELLTSSITR